MICLLSGLRMKRSLAKLSGLVKSVAEWWYHIFSFFFSNILKLVDNSASSSAPSPCREISLVQPYYKCLFDFFQAAWPQYQPLTRTEIKTLVRYFVAVILKILKWDSVGPLGVSGYYLQNGKILNTVAIWILDKTGIQMIYLCQVVKCMLSLQSLLF